MTAHLVWEKTVTTGRRLTGLLLMAFFLQCVILNGVVLTRGLPLSCRDNNPSIVTIDVCGHGAHTTAAQHLDLKAGFPDSPVLLFSFENLFPRNPDEAVASAPPGDIEKPPEA